MRVFGFTLLLVGVAAFIALGVGSYSQRTQSIIAVAAISCFATSFAIFGLYFAKKLSIFLSNKIDKIFAKKK